MRIHQVAIVSGTHGNEFTGIYLLRRWANNPDEIKRDSFTTETIWANPKAFDENKRYIDVDLNRCFLRDDLKDATIDSYEGNRAKVINAYLGPKENPAFDFIFDVHTTTSNMGITLILIGNDKYDLALAAYIKSFMPNVHLYCFNDQSGDHPYLASITPHRLGLEIGPIPQCTLRHDIFDQANEALRLGLDYIHRVNVGDQPEHRKDVEVFVHRKYVNFPVDENGNICAMIHSKLQDQDFKMLKKGDAVFVTLDGETVVNHETKIVYPAFINEAAYYEKKIAFSLAHMTTMLL